jgi:hypothetical protein
METIVQAGHKNLEIASIAVVTNAKTRESRLFSSMRQHVFRSAAAIVRSYVMYKPYLIFGWSAIVFGLLGLLPFVRYGVLVAGGAPGGGHLQSLLVGAVLLIMSFLSLMLGVLSDLTRTNRILLENSLEHAKRSRFGDVLTTTPPRPAIRAV